MQKMKLYLKAYILHPPCKTTDVTAVYWAVVFVYCGLRHISGVDFVITPHGKPQLLFFFLTQSRICVLFNRSDFFFVIKKKKVFSFFPVCFQYSCLLQVLSEEGLQLCSSLHVFCTQVFMGKTAHALASCHSELLEGPMCVWTNCQLSGSQKASDSRWPKLKTWQNPQIY